jgi:hypothetical protein
MRRLREEHPEHGGITRAVRGLIGEYLEALSERRDRLPVDYDRSVAEAVLAISRTTKLVKGFAASPLRFATKSPNSLVGCAGALSRTA